MHDVWTSYGGPTPWMIRKNLLIALVIALVDLRCGCQSLAFRHLKIPLQFRPRIQIHRLRLAFEAGFVARAFSGFVFDGPRFLLAGPFGPTITLQ